MKMKKMWISVGAVWFVMVITDFLFHGLWMAPMYEQTSQFWRPMDEMKQMMPLLWIGALLFSSSFVWIYSQGVTKGDPWGQAFRYALAILLVSRVPEHMGLWVTAAFPGEMIARWLVISVVQSLLAAFILTWTYKKTQKVAKA